MRDGQTHQLKRWFHVVDYSSLEKFCLDLEIIPKHIFAKIGFKIFETSYLVYTLMTILYSKYPLFEVVEFNFYNLLESEFFERKED